MKDCPNNKQGKTQKAMQVPSQMRNNKNMFGIMGEETSTVDDTKDGTLAYHC